MMTVNKAIAHLNADKKCCAANPLYPDGRPPLAHTQWAEGFSRYASSTAAKDSSTASFGVFKTGGAPRPIAEALSEFAAEQLIGTCHYTKAFYERAANWLVGEATAKRSKVFIVSDHQWDEVDKFMRDDVKALSYATTELDAFMKRCALGADVQCGGARALSDLRPRGPMLTSITTHTHTHTHTLSLSFHPFAWPATNSRLGGRLAPSQRPSWTARVVHEPRNECSRHARAFRRGLHDWRSWLDVLQDGVHVARRR